MLEDITLTYFINTGIGIVGGIVLIFLALLKKRKLRYSFVYNLFGTFNIITGLIGLALHGNTADPSPYIISACITVGVIMYCSIY